MACGRVGPGRPGKAGVPSWSLRPRHCERERGTPMTALEHDALYVLRRLARAPGFALASVTLLGLAIATSACVFAVVYCLLWKPLPFPGADRLVNIVQPFLTEDWARLL